MSILLFWMHSLFLFPIVFGINLIHFFCGKNKIGLGRIWSCWSFVLGFRSLVARLVPFERGGTKWAKKCLAIESVILWTHCQFQRHNGDLSVKGETGSVKGETKSAKGKCKFITNFSATMVTSLPSLSLSLSVSLSLSLTESTSRTI